MSLVTPSIVYFPDPTKGRPVFNGQIFIGEPDLDPEIPANQKQATLRLEDGSLVNVGQPVLTGPGGTVSYNGSYAVLTTDGDFSLTVLNAQGSRVYYIPNNENIFDASQIGIVIEGSSTNLQSYLENRQVADYTELRALASTDPDEGIIDGTVIFVTNDGIAGQFVVKTGTVTDDAGTLIVFTDDSNRYAERVDFDAVTPEMFGAAGDNNGTVGNGTDDSTAINNMIQYCGDTGKSFRFESSHRISSQIVLDRSYLTGEFSGNARLVPDSALLVPVLIGDASAPPTRMKIKRLKVDRVSIVTATENEGVRFIEVNQSDFSDFEVRWAKYPMHWVTDTAGCAYNNFYNMQAIGGVRNWWLEATAPGFTNENKFFGGRCFDGGDMVTQIYIDGGTASNNNVFFSPSVEGSGDQSIYCNGQQNLFIQPRTEGTWVVDDVVYGADSRFNRVESSRLDISVTDYAGDDTNTWQTRTSGSKMESGDNNVIHHRAVHTGVHTTGAGSPVVISGATQASPVVVTSTAHGLASGSYITIRKVGGMEEINHHAYRLGTVTANTFELLEPRTGANVDGTNFTAYTSGGYAMPGVPMNSIEDINESSTASHVYDIYHGEDNGDSYTFRGIRYSDGLVRSSLTTDGRMTLARRLEIEQSGYTFEPFQMGNYYFWMNGNDFRGSIGAPASATDGTLIATLT
ncbi:MAG: hypothetical protein CMI54_04820 [Parcubacteria group bacterium]|nr:hypothetical protein [Parcubacteria group bacterium]|tara:strand:+ start:28080 stop:30140 length:2061 start_codon:yes stop_codon:yes gene_type:complete